MKKTQIIYQTTTILLVPCVLASFVNGCSRTSRSSVKSSKEQPIRSQPSKLEVEAAEKAKQNEELLKGKPSIPTSETRSGEQNPAVNGAAGISNDPQKLAGNFVGPCNLEGKKGIRKYFSFAEGSYESGDIIYHESSCKTPYFSSFSVGKIIGVNDAVDGFTNYSLTFGSRGMKPHGKIAEQIFKYDKVCGLENWKDTVLNIVDSFPPDRFCQLRHISGTQAFKLNGNELHVGNQKEPFVRETLPQKGFDDKAIAEESSKSVRKNWAGACKVDETRGTSSKSVISVSDTEFMMSTVAFSDKQCSDINFAMRWKTALHLAGFAFPVPDPEDDDVALYGAPRQYEMSILNEKTLQTAWYSGLFNAHDWELGQWHYCDEKVTCGVKPSTDPVYRVTLNIENGILRSSGGDEFPEMSTQDYNAMMTPKLLAPVAKYAVPLKLGTDSSTYDSVVHVQGMLYASRNGEVAKSVDFGKNWTKLVTKLPDVVDSVNAIVASGGRLFARSGVLLETTDAGSNWKAVGPIGTPYSLTENAVYSLAVSSKGDIFAAMHNDLTTMEKGTNAWKSLSGLPGKSSITPFASDGNYIYAGFEGAVFRAQEGKEPWEKLSIPFEGVSQSQSFSTRVTKLEAEGDLILGGVYGGGLVFSSDAGKTWSHLKQHGGTQLFNADLSVNRKVAMDVKVHRGVFYAAIDSFGIIHSVDKGQTWELLSVSPLAKPRSLLVKNGSLIVGTLSGLYMLMP